MPNPVRMRRLSGSPYAKIAAKFLTASSQYLEIADNASLSMGAGVSLTLAGWFRPDDTTGSYALLAKGALSVAASVEYALFTNGAAQFAVRTSNGTTLTTITANNVNASFTAGQWCFVYFTHDGANDVIAVNQFSSTVANTNAAQDSTNPFRLGANAGGTTFYNGLSDSVGVWKRVLTAAELSFLYNGGVGVAFRDLPSGIKASLQGWWDLDGNGLDASGNGNNLTNNNSVSYATGKR